MNDENKTKHWFAYISGDPLNNENYFLISTKPDYSSSGKSISAVYTTNDGQIPNTFSTKLKTHIATALATQEPQYSESNYPIILVKP